ncbi:hypothetical protein PLICRDRAFT_47203 [Plicaturopsis crispa FD-325 SS-3]|uniref:DUF6533 domain-containing protein n=1 Tax=Plicaturopsis crispa FD-325 SS-3 TaxID=944288 RepID=A0A0C9T269_PLICR|nr:hypothetical protein PLICRDRAFT_47203 [Plicaturopsis crispa FD-325 SS-3]
MAVSEDATSAAQDLMTRDCLNLLSMTMLFYDQLTTLSSEITYIWTRPRSASSIVFLLNRLLAFLGNLVVAVETFTGIHQEVCSTSSLGRQIILIINELVVGVLLTLRVHALYQHNRRVLALLLAMGFLTLGLCGWSMTAHTGTVSQQVYPGCHIAYTAMSGYYLAVPWEMLFVFDCMIYVLTLRATYNGHRQHQGLMLTSGRLPLVSLLLRDGALYFGVIALANLSNILTFYLSSALLKGCLSSFASNLSVLLISRLMLNMHENVLTGDPWTTSTHHAPTVRL